MNREQAIKAVADKIGLSGPFTDNLVDAMAAVGVLKLEQPAPTVKWSIPCTEHSMGMATIREDTLFETLRMAGYEVRKRTPMENVLKGFI